MLKEENKDVNKPKEGGESSEPQEKESSPEVKTEEKPEVKPEAKPEAKPKDVEPDKDREHIDNLNKALNEERGFRKRSDEKISQLESELKQSSEILDRFKQAINPESKEEKEPEFLTKEDAESLLQERDKQWEIKQKEDEMIKSIKEEVIVLEKKYDGKDGRLKYNDQEVLQWQKDNNKEYLTPRQAFFEKEHDAIIDFEVKQRLAGKKEVADVEKPSGGEQTHQPKETTPKTDQEIRQAVEEAMTNVEKEL